MTLWLGSARRRGALDPDHEARNYVRQAIGDVYYSAIRTRD